MFCLVERKYRAFLSTNKQAQDNKGATAKKEEESNQGIKMSIKSNNDRNFFILIYPLSTIVLVFLLLSNNNGQQEPGGWAHCQKVTHLNNNNYQKLSNIPIPLNNVVQQLAKTQRNTNLYSKHSNSDIHHFNNITFSNRPLDRPSLSLVSTPVATTTTTFPSSSSSIDQQYSNSSTQGQEQDQSSLANAPEVPESPADWLMMEGNDLLPEEGKSVASFESHMAPPKSTRRSGSSNKRSNKNKSSHHSNNNSSSSGGKSSMFDDDSVASDSSDSNDVLDDIDEGQASMAGTSKEPECAAHGRYYCTYKEEYPLKLVTEVTKYYKWPLEKLFRDLHAQIMPKLAQDSTGNLVCDSITRVVRPGWARNTNERWLVVINTENYHQYVTEVVCQYGSNSRCNFIPPCYYSSCQQRYNTQKLLVIDPSNPYRGPFLSEFLFPSCCVCYVPSASDSFQDKYRSSPATIYQRTMQQESANNLFPPQFKPAGLLEDTQASLVSQQQDHHASSSRIQLSSNNNNPQISLTPGVPAAPGQKEPNALAPSGGGGSGAVALAQNQAPGPGEIRRRAGELQQHRHGHNGDMEGFPRLGLIDSLGVNQQQATSGPANSGAQQK